MVDTTLAFNILARDRGAASTFDKIARSADKTTASLKRTTTVSAAAAKASAALTKAHDDESGALDKVQSAEAKLTAVRESAKAKASQVQAAEAKLREVRANSKARTSDVLAAETKLLDARATSKAKIAQVVAAENSLAAARRKAAAAGHAAQTAAKDLGNALDDEGKKAGKSLGAGLKKWFTGEGGGLFAQIGKDGSSVFGSGFLGALKTPILGPVIAAVIASAVITVMPAVGAVAASAFVLAFGAGLIGLGAVFAAKSNGVKNAWKSTLKSMGDDMRVIAQPFQRTLSAMAGFAKTTFAGFKPQLEVAFKELAPVTTEFGAQLGHAFEQLEPAIQPLAAATAAVEKSLGPGLVDAIGEVSQGLVAMADSVKDSPDGLTDLVKGTGELFHSLSDGIATLNNINGAVERFTGGFSAVDGVMAGVKWAVDQVLGPFYLLEAAMDKVGLKAGHMNDTVKISADTAKLWTQGLTAAQVAAVNAGSPIPGVSAKVESLSEKFDRQTRKTDALITSLFRLQNGYLTLSGAQISYQAAIDNVTASIKENGKTHDINTAKGRANKTALLEVAKAANDQTESMIRNNKGTAAAASTAEKTRANFVKLATQMGYTVPQARAMAKQMISIPNVTRTAKLQANKADLESKLAAAKRQLADPHLTASKKAKLLAEIKNLQAGIATAKAALGSVPSSKTVTIKVNTYKNLIETASIGGTPSSVAAPKHRAGGGPVTKGETYVVGEKRAELFVPDQNGTILPQVPAKAMGSGVAVGMAQGIRGGASSAISAAGDIANAVLGKARAVLGISSPSKAFAQIGLYVNQGFSVGIRGSAKSVQSTMASLMSKVLNISFNAAEAKASVQKTIASLNASIAAARKRIKPIESGMTKSQVAAAKRNNAAVADSIKSLQTKLRAARTDLANVTNIASTLGTAKKRNAIIGMIQRENKLMQAMATQRASVAAKLKSAQAKLTAAIQIRDEFRKNITDSALAFNSITNITPEDGQALSGEGLIARMQQTLAKTKEFASNLARLKSLGLRSDLYKQIAEAGVEAGGATAQALLQNGTNTVAAANSLQAQIASASTGLGNTAAANLYQAGVNAAQGLVNGLLAKTKALDAASKKLADAIVAQIKKTLGIRSPSRVLMGLGSMTGQGFTAGIEGEYGNVAKAGVGLGNAAMNIGAPRWAAGSGSQTGSGGVTININVTGALDPNAVALQIQQLLIRFKRNNGGIALGIA